MMTSLGRLFAAAPHQPRLPDAEVRRRYPRLRLQILEATFLGYATFYVVRNNLSIVSKDMQGALHYDRSMVGTILACTALSYGLGKFLMGGLSDRSNARLFMPLGLLLTAICNFAFGSVASFHAHLALWALNGFVQGMGWPPCGRCMGHWFSQRERGLTFSIWNTSHNLGGGLAAWLTAWAVGHYGGWQYAFYVPGVVALIGSLYLLVRLRDTPQSVGLPPIEEYAAMRAQSAAAIGAFPVITDAPGGPAQHAPSVAVPASVATSHHDTERELTFRELFIDHVLANKYVWILAIANFFAYIARYVMLDWGPMYFREVKNATLEGGGWVVLTTEFSGIPSTILLGWVSDLLKGRRGLVATLCLAPIALAFLVIALTPTGHRALDLTMLGVIGFFIYPVINLIVIMALDLTSKKAIGAAAGFIGLFGYIGRMTQAQGIGWLVDHLAPTIGKHEAWQLVLWIIVGCTVVSLALMALTWRMRPRQS